MGNYEKHSGDACGQGEGVPLGGIGAGGLEACCDGWFRNLTLNNNRTTSERIPLAAHTFLALRVETGPRTYVRYLQQELPGLPAHSPFEPLRLRKDQFEWRGEFPAAHFHLVDPECPAEVTWTCFSPVMPYDHDAAAMPVFLVSVSVKNPTEETLNGSVVFNLENLCGAAGAHRPKVPAPIERAMIDERPRYEIKFMRSEEKAPGVVFRQNPEAKQTVGVTPAPAPRNALHFGSAERPPTSAHGEYCLAVHHVPDARYALFAWDHRDPAQRFHFWQVFATTGLPGEPETPGVAASGAVAIAIRVSPGAVQRFDFAWSWHCPLFDLGGENAGNAYSVKRKSAFEVAKHALEHVEYFYTASSEWQRRLSASTLPPWLVHALVNSGHIFVTNALYTRNGAFALFDSPDRPVTARLDQRLYSSFATVLFYPRFEETELSVIAAAEHPDTTGRLSRALGSLCVNKPDLNPPFPVYIELGAQLVLMAYRNYVMTGKLVRLQDLEPLLRTVMAKIAARDADADGLPDVTEESRTLEGIRGRGISCYAAGLWLAALRAYVLIAERQGDRSEAIRYGLLGKRAAETIENTYWDEDRGYYRLYPPCEDEPLTHAACHAGQLVAQWQAELLGFGALLRPQRVERALDSIARMNACQGGYLAAVLPNCEPCPAENEGGDAAVHVTRPGEVRAYFHALQIYRDRADAALHALDHQYRLVFQHACVFNQPEAWDLDTGEPARNAPMRHIATLSIWYVLYAIQGFFLNVPGQHVRIKPNLPRGVSSVSTPLVTPLCLGWLKYKVDFDNGYRQRIRLSFDSPVQIKSVELRVPAELAHVSVVCNGPDGRLGCRTSRTAEDDAQRLLVQFEKTISVTSGISIQVSVAAPPDAEQTDQLHFAANPEEKR